jgi:hypothetical protein
MVLAIQAGDTNRVAFSRKQLRRLGYRLDVAVQKGGPRHAK